MTSEEMMELAIDDSFAFSCFPGISCFNACCRDLNQFLTPYDVLRLKQRLALSAGSFLEQYTSSHTGPQTGLPVVTLRPGDMAGRVCPFVENQGCRVYPDRPSSCRIYPLIRVLSRSRETGELTARYMMLQETHCHGFETGRRRTVRQWIEQQGLVPYNHMNDALMELIAMKNQWICGPLPRDAVDFLYTLLYDVDRLRQWLLEGRLDAVDAAAGVPDPHHAADEELLRFAMGLAFARLRELGKGPGSRPSSAGERHPAGI